MGKLSPKHGYIEHTKKLDIPHSFKKYLCLSPLSPFSSKALSFSVCMTSCGNKTCPIDQKGILLRLLQDHLISFPPKT